MPTVASSSLRAHYSRGDWVDCSASRSCRGLFQPSYRSVADTNAAMHGLVGLLAALYKRAIGQVGITWRSPLVDATVVTNDGMHYALDGINVGVTNEVHETAGGLLMLAGEFRYIWKMLSSIYNVSDGLEEAQNMTFEKKLKPAGLPLNIFLLKPAAPETR